MNQIFPIANTISILIQGIIFLIPIHPYSFVIEDVLHIFDVVLYASMVLGGDQQNFILCLMMRKYKLWKGGFLIPVVTSSLWYYLYFSKQKSFMMLCCVCFCVGLCSLDCFIFVLFLVWINLVQVSCLNKNLILFCCGSIIFLTDDYSSLLLNMIGSASLVFRFSHSITSSKHQKWNYLLYIIIFIVFHGMKINEIITVGVIVVLCLIGAIEQFNNRK